MKNSDDFPNISQPRIQYEDTSINGNITPNIDNYNTFKTLYINYHYTIMKQSNDLLAKITKFSVCMFIAFLVLYIYCIDNCKPTDNLTILWGISEGIIAILVGLIKFIELKQMEYYKSLDKKQDREQIYSMIKEGINDENMKCKLIEKLIDEHVK